MRCRCGASFIRDVPAQSERPDQRGSDYTGFTSETVKGVNGLRVAVSATCGYADIDPARLTPLDAAGHALAEAGARIDYADPPIWNFRKGYVTLCESAFGGVVAGMGPERMALLDPG